MGRTVYNNAFLLGLYTTLILWGIVACVSYEIAKAEYDKSAIKFSGGPVFDWGVPFYWTHAGGFFANAVLVALSSILIGHFFRFIQDKYFAARDE